MKLAFVTGGSRGLGAALLASYVEDGFTVRDLSRTGHSPHAVHIDLSEPTTVQTIIAPLFTDFARQPLTEVLLFSNAGMTAPLGMLSTKDTASILANIHVNYTSPVLLIREFIKAFQDNPCPKTVVSITSGAAQSTMHGSSLYSSTKAGMEQFIRVTAAEQTEQPYPILAINIAPGFVDTAMQQEVRSTPLEDFPLADAFKGLKESGALLPPEVVADEILKILAENPEPGSRHDVRERLS